MNLHLRKEAAILGVPMDLGADRRGVDMGPSAMRCAELKERLEGIGYRVYDEGDLVTHRTSSRFTVPGSNLKYLDEIARVNKELAHSVAEMVGKGRFPLILGGDHSIAIGSLAGVCRQSKQVGVLWFDAHGDVNTAETSPTGNIHGMALAVAMGYGHPALTGISGSGRVKPQHAVIVGARSLDHGERLFLKKHGVKVYTMHDIDRLGIVRVMEQALEILTRGTNGVHVSLDLDALDPREAPGVGTPVEAGISLREGLLAAELLADAGVVTSADVVEVNPVFDERNRTAKAAVELTAALLGEKIL